MDVGVELVTCRSCGAPNHPARPACGRCRAAFPRPGRAPAVSNPAGSDPAVSDPTGSDPAGSDPAGDDAVAAVAATPPEADESTGRAPVADRDATAATPVTVTGAGTDATAAVAAVVDERARNVGARVLDLLRGPDASDTQPLDAGTTSATPPQASEDQAPRRPHRSLVVVSVLGVLAGAVVGIAAARGGLFPAEGEEPVPAFDAGVYRRPPVELEVGGIRATSYLPPTGSNDYAPELVLDDELATAWNSDGTGRPDGVGEELALSLEEPAWVTAVEFANGYQKDDVRFLANARLARATVEFDGGERVNVVLLDQSGWQRVPLPQPILATSMTIEVLETFPGDTYRDLAISGIRVLGHPAVGADREAALERAREPAEAT